MAAPSVTYTFSNSTTADATQVNTNFTDLVNSLSDGLKDLTISSLSTATIAVSGAATFNGTVALGNATSDDITVTGYIASAILPKTSGSYSLGSTAQNWDALYLDKGATNAGSIYFDAGTTKYIQGNAAGTILTIGGFTSMVPPAAINAAGALTIGTNGNTTALTLSTAQVATFAGRVIATSISSDTGASFNLVDLPFLASRSGTQVSGFGITGRVTHDIGIYSTSSSDLLRFGFDGGSGFVDALTLTPGTSVAAFTGLLDISASTAGQIKFPASQNASADANTLDDYEEFTFTATVQGLTTAGTYSYAFREGSGTKIGNRVSINIFVSWSSTGSDGSGDLIISGLPFTVGSFSAGDIGYLNNITLNANSIATAYADSGSTYIRIAQYATGGGGMSPVPIDHNGGIILSMQYRI